MENNDHQDPRAHLEAKREEDLTGEEHIALAIYHFADVVMAYLDIADEEDEYDV